ncbi:disintegrin and metalloproteinase domain-containing protein 33 isoform X2 [Hyla sarda]|uniref:disintegrin and metalloproteinase domain-containing protein 33 isoform X2 n=1 Tax=Hyla sarda TaxID=327740 RepID=UPI0024C2CC2B|nr:disintegrin and metalloproteinase domain-containing protein 33 isoform X2 [Hyla sarda]
MIFIFMQQFYLRTNAMPWSRNQRTTEDFTDNWASGIYNTVTYKSLYDNQLQYSVRINEKDHILHLKKTPDLLTLNFTASHYKEDGSLVTETPGHLAHCCYTGSVDGIPGSVASVCTCHGLSGYVTIGDETYSIDPFMYNSSDHVITTVVANSHRRQQRSLQSNSREGQQYTYSIELFLVADNKEYQRHEENLEKTRHHLISVAHHLNQILSRINFQVFLVGVEIWTRENKAVVSETASATLRRFLQWRTEYLLPRKHHDNVQLISGAHFRNHVLGEAFLGKMCTESQSGGIIKDTGLSARELAKYIAHEIGHNLGMSHDTEHCYCPAATGKCLLTQRTGHNMNEMFSDCSHRSLHRFLAEKDITCLMDKPHTYIDEPTLQDNPMEMLETIGKVSVFLCLVVAFLALIIIFSMKTCRRPGEKTLNKWPS